MNFIRYPYILVVFSSTSSVSYFERIRRIFAIVQYTYQYIYTEYSVSFVCCVYFWYVRYVVRDPSAARHHFTSFHQHWARGHQTKRHPFIFHIGCGCGYGYKQNGVYKTLCNVYPILYTIKKNSRFFLGMKRMKRTSEPSKEICVFVCIRIKHISISIFLVSAFFFCFSSFFVVETFFCGVDGDAYREMKYRIETQEWNFTYSAHWFSRIYTTLCTVELLVLCSHETIWFVCWKMYICFSSVCARVLYVQYSWSYNLPFSIWRFFANSFCFWRIVFIISLSLPIFKGRIFGVMNFLFSILMQ